MNHIKLTMAKDTILCLDGDSRGTIISCREGMVSVTQINDREDHILSDNNSFRIDRKGRIAAWALSQALVEIDCPHVNRWRMIDRLRGCMSAEGQ